MNLQLIAFYLCAAFTVFPAALVVTARNPVHAAFALILTFVSSAGLLLLLGAEFLALLILLVYAGAVAVLFLFVVMMLHSQNTENHQPLRHVPAALLTGAVLLVELVFILAAGAENSLQSNAIPQNLTPNIQQLGAVLYTRYVLFFQLAGLLLLASMIGAVVLVHQPRQGVKKQNPSRQIARNPATAIEIKKIPSASQNNSLS